MNKKNKINIFYQYIQRMIYFMAGRKHFTIYRLLMDNKFRSVKSEPLVQLSWVTDSIPKYNKIVINDHGLNTFPIVRKNDLQNGLDLFINKNFNKKKLILSYTGGSTGEPTNFYLTKHFRDVMSAAIWRSWTWVGWQPGESLLYIWGSPHDIKTNWKRKLIDAVNRKTIINAFNCDESDYEEWIKKINIIKPSLLYGYSNSIASLARYILDKKPFVFKPKAIMTSAEPLFPENRNNIEQAFGVKAYSLYGSREMWVIASECKEKKMHIFTDICYLESIPDDKGIYHLLLTTYDNEAMPLIRYDLGDVGKITNEKCLCGSSFPVLDIKLARQLDFIIGPNSKRIDPYFCYYKMYNIKGIEKYQFYQKEDLSIEIRVVKNRLFSDDTVNHLNEVRQELKRKLSDKLVCEVVEVDEIQPTRSGKHKFIISEVQ